MFDMARGFVAVAALAVALPAAAQAQAAQPPSQRVTFTGTVIDVSCKFRNGLTGADHQMCAQVCADRGIPLAILASNGTLYIPVTVAMPGDNQNPRLKEFAEQQVTVTGQVVDAGGAKAIDIESIRRAG
jgi:type 1 fimbria pilin